MIVERGPVLLEQLLRLPLAERDPWIDDVLGFEPPPPDEPLPRGAVPYLPCSVDDIVALVCEVPLCAKDVLVDLGSGLGRVAILAHLLSGARAVGVEIQQSLVAKARARCAALALDRVSFVHANAADIELDGTVFFLYAPCNGELLARVLHRIQAVRHAVVACVGVDLDVPWLAPRPPVGALTIYDRRVCAG